MTTTDATPEATEKPKKRQLIPAWQARLLDEFRAQLPADLQDRAFLNEAELADVLGQSILTVRKWRVRKVGPKFQKHQRTVRYSVLNAAIFALGEPKP